jgi:hypothetical protein
MNSSSRQLTGQTGKTYPAVAHGLIRHWGKIETTTIASPLVAEFGEGQINGVLLEVSASEIPHFDRREHGYERHPIKLTDIHETPHSLNENDAVWVYIKHKPTPPCENTPVLQTYIDTVLAGCLEVSESFADFFIQNTQGWHYPIYNDRHQSRYVNYVGVEQSKLAIIDSLLKPIVQTR